MRGRNLRLAERGAQNEFTPDESNPKVSCSFESADSPVEIRIATRSHHR